MAAADPAIASPPFLKPIRHKPPPYKQYRRISNSKRVLPSWFGRNTASSSTGGFSTCKSLSDQEQINIEDEEEGNDKMTASQRRALMSKQLSLPDRCEQSQQQQQADQTRLLQSVCETAGDGAAGEPVSNNCSLMNSNRASVDEPSGADDTDSVVSTGSKLGPLERHSAYATPQQAQQLFQQRKFDLHLQQFAFGISAANRKTVNFNNSNTSSGSEIGFPDATSENRSCPSPAFVQGSGPRRAFSLRFGLGRNKATSRSTMEHGSVAAAAAGAELERNRHRVVLRAPNESPVPDIVLTESALENVAEDGSLPGSVRLVRHHKHAIAPSRSSSVRYHIEAFFEVSDNRLAMKLFGNRRALDKEKERQQNTARYVVHPCSKFRFYWDLIMLMLLLSNMILLPVAIAFFSEDFMQPGWLTFNCISDTFFILDIIINFRTGIIADEPGSEVILDPREIAVYYLKTWFFIDFISSIPIDYIFMIVVFFDGQPMHSNTSLLHAGRAFRVMRLAKLLGLLRLLRLSRLVRYINQWQEFLNVATMVLRITNLIGLTFLLAHWNGCLQYLVPTLQGYPENSWVTKRGIQNATWFRQYTLSIFRALSHMLSIGYGQDIPDTTAEVWLTIGSMLAGATCYAIFVGHMTNLIHSYDSSRRMYTEKLKQVQEYMFYRKLPRSLRDRITDYYEHRYQGKMFDEAGIMDELSQTLREDVIGYNCRVLIQRVPFFENAEVSFLSDVLTKLRPELFQPSDLIIKEGTIGKRMYFIQDGAVDIIKNNEIATTLTEGSYFGEICLLTNTKRCATVRAVTYCQLFSLHKNDFDEVLQHYPVMKRTLKGIAAQRLYKIGENPRLVSRSGELAEDLNTAHEILNEPQGMTTVTRPGFNAPEDELMSNDSGTPGLRLPNRRRSRGQPVISRENSATHGQPVGANSHYYRQHTSPVTHIAPTEVGSHFKSAAEQAADTAAASAPLLDRNNAKDKTPLTKV